MAADALDGLGWTETEIAGIPAYADQVDIFLPHPGSSNHRVWIYQQVFQNYGGEYCGFMGAESWAAGFASLAQASYASGDKEQAKQDLGYAIHFIQDALNPPHVFPFSENSTFGNTHWGFELHALASYGVGGNNWQALVRNAPVEPIASGEELRQKVKEAADWVNGTFQPPRVSYISHNGTVVGDPPDSGWYMTDSDIGECISRAASLVKGAARWANPQASPIIVPDEYSTIQQAIDVANPGAPIHVRTGIYYENLIVNKRVSLVGEDLSNTIIDGGGIGSVIAIAHDNVTVTGFTVRDSEWVGLSSCILVEGSSGCNISHNIISTDGFGICLSSSDSTVIAGNSVTSMHTYAGDGGILLLNSGNNVLDGNVVSGGYLGIRLSGFSNDNILRNNHVHSTVEEGIWLVQSGYNTLTGNSIVGVDLWGFGVQGNSSLAFDNDIDTSNTVDGKPIYYVTGAANVVYGAQTDAATIYLIDCQNIIIRDMTLQGNLFGMCFWNTMNSRIENVILASNGWGAFLGSSNDNVIADNSVYWNDGGIFLLESNDNRIFHNDFTPHKVGLPQVISINSINIWDDGYPSGGNYWSDYSGVDADDDGIGDTPYVIDVDNQDNYPLMHPYIAGDINYDGTVTVIDLCALGKSYGTSPGDPQWNDRADISNDDIIDSMDLNSQVTNYGR